MSIMPQEQPSELDIMKEEKANLYAGLLELQNEMSKVALYYNQLNETLNQVKKDYEDLDRQIFLAEHPITLHVVTTAKYPSQKKHTPKDPNLMTAEEAQRMLDILQAKIAKNQQDQK